MGYDLTILYQYMMFKEQYYRNDSVQLGNNINYRNADPIDHLEMIMAQVRVATAQEIFSDMHKLMRLIKNSG